ncbi:MAG: hypothetical protein C4550_05665 [Nitrospiraceae bacterium]|nr:MAG: hypothetical protein C4550_05665 [Nitrospiraceae bacterium]
MSNGTLPDGFVSGSIHGEENTKASVLANVSCTGSIPAPTGTISGTVEFPSEQFTRKFTFSSNSPFVVATIKSNSTQSVGAAFDNVTVQEDEFTPLTGCKAYLDATRLDSSRWIGSFTIVCPSGPQLFIYGIFGGSVVVNRQVFCRPLQ